MWYYLKKVWLRGKFSLFNKILFLYNCEGSYDLIGRSEICFIKVR